MKKVIITTKWIPVTEKLPEQGKNVMVFRPGLDVFWDQREARYDIEWHDGKNFIFEDVFGPVSHWMPLPKPPKA